MDMKREQRIFPKPPRIPSPYDGGGWGWIRPRSGGSPFPFIPSHRGEGRWIEGYVYPFMDPLVTAEVAEYAERKIEKL